MLSHIRNVCGKCVGKIRNQKGQGLVEYALILVLIAIVVIAAVKSVGNSTSNTFSKINSNLQPVPGDGGAQRPGSKLPTDRELTPEEAGPELFKLHGYDLPPGRPKMRPPPVAKVVSELTGALSVMYRRSQHL